MRSSLLRHRAAVATAALVGLAVAGCAGWSSNPVLTLHVTSSVDRPLLIYVNDAWVGTIAARAGEIAVPVSGSIPAPYAVQARTDKGRVLGSLEVSAAQARDPVGVATEGALACGTLRLAVGSGAAGSAAVGAGATPNAAAVAPTCD